MDRPVDAKIDKVPESASEEVREFVLTHFAGGHCEFAVAGLPQAGNVARDPNVVRRIREHHLGSFTAKQLFIAFGLKRIPAQEDVIADVPAVARLRYRWQGAVNLRDDVGLIRHSIVGLANDEIDFSDFEAGDRDVEIRLDGSSWSSSASRVGSHPACSASRLSAMT